MSKLSNSAKQVLVAFGLISAFLCLFVGSAAAAPAFEVKLQSDPLANEVQKVTVKATGGTYRLNFGEGGPGVSETADIAFNASAAQVAMALNAIANVSGGGGFVSVTGGPGDELGTKPYVVSFEGALRLTDVDEMTVSPGSVPLSGGSELASVKTTNIGGIYRGDLRTDYTVTVKNTAGSNPSPGDTLTCNIGGLSWFQEPTFTFKWVSNGAPASGPTAHPTATTSTYLVQPADAGHSVQCVIKGINAGGAAASFTNPIVVNPVPTSPGPPSFGASANRPTIENKGTAQVGERVCKLPTGWSGVGASDWTYQWLRNGEPIAGATNPSYVPVAGVTPGENDRLVNLQCQITGSNASGTVIATSNNSLTGTPAEFTAAPPAGFGKVPPNNNSENRPFISFSNGTSGPVTAELELPAGQETFVVKTTGTGWTCSKQAPAGLVPAKAICTRSDVLTPQSSYPSLTVSIGLGADAPELSQVKATVSGGGGSTTSVTDEFSIGPAKPFEITAFETQVPDPEGNEETQAGAHPIQAFAAFATNRRRGIDDKASAETFVSHQNPVETVKHLNVHTPRGFVGNALAVPELCPSVELTLTKPTQCPEGSIVGGISLVFTGVGALNMPVYSMKPEYGLPAQFAFSVTITGGVYTFYPELRADDGYAISFLSSPVPMNPELIDGEVTLCGFGAKTRLGGNETFFNGCKQPGEPGANPTPLITLPTRCAGIPPVTVAEIDSWQNPGVFKTREFEAQRATGCEKVEFQPSAEIKPTSQQADSPTGLDVELTMPTEGLEGKDSEGNLDPNALAQSNMKMTRVTFPEGMAINPSAGQGLGSCSEAQVDYGTNDPISCPDSSKIGTIEIDTPIIQETLTGAMYIGRQSEAPEGSLIGLHLVFESKKDGIIIKIPGEVKTNPKTGQLVTIFDEILEDPFSRVKISFNQGPRSSLLNPPKCGTYAVKTEMVPWTIKDLENPDPSEIVTQNTSFEVTEGPGGGPCPSGALEAKLNAGTTNPLAGQSTSFEMGIARSDGSQRINGLDMTLPPGILGVLKGVPYCPEAAIQEAMSRGDVEEGQIEIDSPACPEASRIGSVTAGAGGGPNPIYVDTGKAYLGGPYKGAPLSLVVIAPAVAGPLDLGTVVVRNQLRIDRRTTAISAISDPIPTILHGVLLDLRDVRLTVDRPNFILNPTNCEQMGFAGQVSGESGARAPVSDRFQLTGCENLGFKPKLQIKLIGGTKRGDHPSLLASLKTRPGDANIARAAVTLPPSAFLDQAHIRTICTRVQFAAESCPKGAIYGSTQATTPLLEETLAGNVILRSSDNKLPDLVGTLNGIATVDVVGRIDSVRGGLRSTFDLIPDAPVSTFDLRMQGGNKGLVINSKDLCATRNRATVKFTAQNGRQYNTRPLVIATNCKKAKKKASKKNRGAANSR